MSSLITEIRALFGPRHAAPERRRALLRLIATASEERVELAPLVEAWAADTGGKWRFHLEGFAKTLRGGAKLPDAMERRPWLFGDEEILLARVASESGTLGPALREHLERDERLRPTPQSRPNLLVYFFVGVPICLFIATQILPSIQQLADEFGITEPPAMAFAKAVSHWVTNYWYLPFLLLAVVWSINRFGWLRRPLRRRFAGRLSHAVRSGRIAAVLRRLGESATAGRPLAGSISTLARYHYDPSIRRKLLYVHNELAQGAELWATLLSVGLLSPKEGAAIATADAIDLRGWTLKALADARSRGSAGRLSLLQSIFWLAMLLLIAVFVFLAAWTVFGMLENLISSLA